MKEVYIWTKKGEKWGKEFRIKEAKEGCVASYSESLFKSGYIKKSTQKHSAMGSSRDYETDMDFGDKFLRRKCDDNSMYYGRKNNAKNLSDAYDRVSRGPCGRDGLMVYRDKQSLKDCDDWEF